MTSPPLTDQTPREDPTEGLRVLVADLLALTSRLELKQRTPDLQATLKAAQERVCGPRALVMLLSEHAELKRRFLERLLGPNLALVPNPTTECMRLEYGAEPESTVTMPQGRPTAAPPDPLESFLNRRTLSDAGDNIPISIPISDIADGTPGAIPDAIPDAIPYTNPDTPRQAMQTIRLPNPTLKGGLAVIDTPAVESGEPSASVLGCVEQADAWIFVLNADHALSGASQALLRRLPERGARLEMVVENAEALSGEERMAARDRLMQTLREQCNIEAPRLTLVASAATEGDEGNFWHGRFATFHSVMMLRGRERWLEGTRAMVLDALSKVAAEIDLELKSIALGVRHARLRLGMKDLDGLRARFYALVGGGPEIESVPEVKPVNPQPAEAVPQQSRLDWSGGSDPATPTEAVSAQSPLELLAEAIAAMAPENAGTEVARPMAGADAAALDRTQGNVAAKRRESEARSIIRESPAAIGAAAIAPGETPVPTLEKRVAEPQVQSAGMAEPAFARPGTRGGKIRPKRGLSVHFSEGLRQLMPHSRAAEPGKFTLLKRIVWVALVIAFICLILWALAPRGFLFGQETPAEWDFQQPTPALASHAAPAAPSGPAAELPQPGNTSGLPDTTGAATPNIPAAPLAKHHGTVRTPLVHPIPSNATAGVPTRAKRHHRHLLGLGKLWHWVRHPHHTRNDQAAQ
jgi:hypothetical protein